MPIPRYAFTDAYTLEELHRKYEKSNVEGRIRILEGFYKDDKEPPFEIAALAVEDPHVEVREWIARHGKYLDYTDCFETDSEQDDMSKTVTLYDATGQEMPRLKVTGKEKRKRDNLEERLKNDTDPFVRACLRENPDVFGGFFTFSEHWIEYFQESTHLERLALIRNPEVAKAPELIQKILDYEDRELDINTTERKELVLAFLTNKEALTTLEEESGFLDGPDGFSITLWELASKWPEPPFDVAYGVYKFIPADDKTKSKIYQECNESVLREAILESCRRHDVETIKLGIRDRDEDCRRHATTIAERLGLDWLVEAAEIESESALSRLMRRWNKFSSWYRKNDLLWGGLVFIAVIIATSFTVDGDLIIARLREISSTPVGAIVFWPLVIFIGCIGILYVLALTRQYRWFYHIFMLSLILWLYQFSEASNTAANIVLIFYASSIVLPKLWVALSDELVEKLIKKLEERKNGN